MELKWEDPKNWILENSPWKLSDIEKNNLRSIKAVDVGCEIESEKLSIVTNDVNQIIRNNKKVKEDFKTNHSEISSEDVTDKVILSTFTSPSKISTKLNNDGDNLINMLMRLQEVTMGNQSKRSVSSRLINEKNITLNNNMILTIPKSLESAL